MKKYIKKQARTPRLQAPLLPLLDKAGLQKAADEETEAHIRQLAAASLPDRIPSIAETGEGKTTGSTPNSAPRNATCAATSAADHTDDLTAALASYIRKAAAGGRMPDARELRGLALRGAGSIRLAERLLPGCPFTAQQRFLVTAAASLRRDCARVQALFGHESRLYLSMTLAPEDRATRQAVEAALDEKDLMIVNYADGLAGRKADNGATGGNRMRIGRLLQRWPRLQRAYQQDPARLSHRQMIVLSRLPEDLARMSCRRRWLTCTDPADAKGFETLVPPLIAEGALIAYLTERSDPQILKPLARILLKPYRNRQGLALYLPDRAAGFSHAVFERTVFALAEDRLNRGRAGVFSTVSGLSPDRLPQRTLRTGADMSATDYLEELGIAFIRTEDDRVIVPGDLVLKDMALSSLPPLENVTVQGNLDVSGNDLSTLAGAPRIVGGDLHCRDNRLQTLAGGPVYVAGRINALGNPGLVPRPLPLVFGALETDRETLIPPASVASVTRAQAAVQTRQRTRIAATTAGQKTVKACPRCGETDCAASAAADADALPA